MAIPDACGVSLGVILQVLNSPSAIQICDHFALVGLSLTDPNIVGD